MRGGSNATLDNFCDMVEWTVDKFGINAVGFGTDLFTLVTLKNRLCGGVLVDGQEKVH